MPDLLHELITSTAAERGERCAIRCGEVQASYAELAESVSAIARGFTGIGLDRHVRVAVFMPKSIETVATFFAVSHCGAIFVPVNPLLKARQVAHILRDSGAEILVSTSAHLNGLQDVLTECPDLHTVMMTDRPGSESAGTGPNLLGWDEFLAGGASLVQPEVIDRDPVAIFYTSGSTGNAKGVILTHRNMVAGARSVATYLHNTENDRILAVLPFSFDYGFSQLTTSFYVGATVVLLNYLFPADVLKAAKRYGITGLAGVPPMWLKLAAMDWPEEVKHSLRYLTNSGGALPVPVIRQLQQCADDVDIFLMYGLTEAFRSTYLSPDKLDERPTSMGKAIPGVQVVVVRPDGTECEPDEPGELVHRGALVAAGYWRDEDRTRERFRPLPSRVAGMPLPEVAVWSGDIVRRDAEGYLYFIGRNDEMIKTSGYRVSPGEVEEAIYDTRSTGAVCVFGLQDADIGQSIVAVVEPLDGAAGDSEQLLTDCRRALPAFMVPARIIWEESLPRNANGKLDRSSIVSRYRADLTKGHE